jgi:hypothetical protein
MTVLQVSTAGTGVVRDAHYVTPTGASTPVRTLLLEPQRTNLCIRSQEFDTWTDTAGCAVSANAGTAPDGTATADLLTASATVADRSRPATFTGDGTKCVSVFLKAGTSTRSVISVRDLTVGVSRHNVRVTWAAGVPTLSTDTGAGTLYPVESYGNGWYRILFSVDSVVAANTNNLRILPDSDLGTGSVLVWGYQAENAVVPSSYIPTAATTVTRNADSLYWGIPALVPRELTVYVRGVDVGTFASGVAARYFAISNAAEADPRLLVFRQTAGTRMFWANAASLESLSDVSTAPQYGDLVELRAGLSSGGAATLGRTLNNGTESVGATGTARVLPASFSGTRFYLAPTATAASLFALTHAAIALGTKSRAEMRAIAGVP